MQGATDSRKSPRRRARRPTRTGTTTWSPTLRSARRSAPGPLIFTARVADSAERDRIWADQKRDYPGFADYETKQPEDSRGHPGAGALAGVTTTTGILRLVLVW